MQYLFKFSMGKAGLFGLSVQRDEAETDAGAMSHQHIIKH